jgi:outer membrane protein assembly factor BamB
MIPHFLMSFTKTLIFLCFLGTGTVIRAEDWPEWRGPRGDGSSREQNLPVDWDGPSGKNILWKTEIPGRGHASPIVVGNRIFLATCREDQKQRSIVCLDRDRGKILWERGVFQAPLERIHPLNSHASGTPAADHQQVYAAFLEPDSSVPAPEPADGLPPGTPGNLVVAAYDFAGNRRWLVWPGQFCSVHGHCSSPVLFEDLVILNADQDGEGYLVALCRRDGKTVWKTPRKYHYRSYCTPIIRSIGGRQQMILSGSKTVSGYDPRDGSLLWELAQGPTDQYVASPAYNGKLLFITGGYPQMHVLAIHPEGRGMLSESAIVWQTKNGAAYVPSPILGGDGKYLFIAADNGLVSCFAAEDGNRLWKKRLGKHYTASPVEAGGLVYFLADDGIVKIIRPGEKLEVVAENTLGETCYASPALSSGKIFIRSEKNLFCIGRKE